MLAATKRGDEATFQAYVEFLVLSDPKTWFATTFGDDLGRQMYLGYEKVRPELTSHFKDSFGTIVREHLSDVRVRRFEKACDPNASDMEYPALDARQQPTPLYDARMANADGSRLMPLWFFVYVDGRFRYTGGLRFYPPWKQAFALSLVPWEIQRKRLVYQPAPHYPSEAKQSRMQGSVLLWAVIATDGSVRELRVARGTCWLTKSAMDAVRQWRYTPMIVDGKPVEVFTTIEVFYTLSF